MRNEKVLKMARYASGGKGGQSYKGRADQSGSETYICRSAFCFSSITPSVKYFADFTRITLLPLVASHGSSEMDASDNWEMILNMINELMGDDDDDMSFSQEFSAYSINNFHSISASFQVLQRVLMKSAGHSSRIADQLGMLLAGFWAYQSSQPITEEQAIALYKKFNWDELIPNKKMENQSQLLSLVKQHEVYVVNEASQKKYARTIAKLVDFVVHEKLLRNVKGHPDLDNFDVEYVKDILRDIGIKLEIESDGKAFVSVSNSGQPIKNILRGTQWQHNWAHSLKALPGAYVPKKGYWFGKAIGLQRCIMIPLEVFLPNETELETGG